MMQWHSELSLSQGITLDLIEANAVKLIRRNKTQFFCIPALHHELTFIKKLRLMNCRTHATTLLVAHLPLFGWV